MTVLQFIPSASNDRGPGFLEPLLDGWLKMVGHEGIRLGIASEKGRLIFLIDCPERCARIIGMQLQNAYPGGRVDYFTGRLRTLNQERKWLRLSPDVYPLKHHSEFIDPQSRTPIDPLESLLEVLKSGRSGQCDTELWLELSPLKRRDGERASRFAQFLNVRFHSQLLRWVYVSQFSSKRPISKFWVRLIIAATRRSKSIPDAVIDKMKRPMHRAYLVLNLSPYNDQIIIAKKKTSEVVSALQLMAHPDSSFFVGRKKLNNSFQLSTREIATLWHFPTSMVHVPRINKQTFLELEPPSDLPRPGRDPSILSLGRVCYRNEKFKFGIDLEARRRHLWILGKTGMGKTTLLQSIIKQDFQNERGFAVIEPHGDLAERSIEIAPRWRKNDIVYFDPADSGNKVTFNPMAVSAGMDKTLVADGVLSAFQKVFGMDESQAPRLLHILRNSLLSLVEFSGSTLLDVQRILVDANFRKTVIARVSNPVVRSFWLDEFAQWKPQDRSLFIASLQNKLGAFLANEKLQRVLGNANAKLNLREVMDNGKVLIVNLSKGRLGENASNLLGSLVTTSLQLAAMSRANVAESSRRDFSIIIDEFQNFSTPAIGTFLSEARKYRTHLIIANQFTRQIQDNILAAIIGNVGSQIAFQVGAEDAELLQRQYGDQLLASPLTNLPRFHAYCRTLLGGVPSRVFSMSTDLR